MTQILPTIELLRELLSYDPQTGVLTWNTRSPAKFKAAETWNTIALRTVIRSAETQAIVWNKQFAGKRAGAVNKMGYRKLVIYPHHLLEHRVIYALIHGVWPKVIDHINGRVDDNRIANLRSVSLQENQQNKKMPKNNTSGFVGVAWNKRENKWRAYIANNYQQIFIGSFTTIEAAVNARREAESKHGFHPNHGRAS